MQNLFPSAAVRAAQSSTLVQFPAGKCVLTPLPTGKYQVTADPRRGQIQLTKGIDDLLHFKWVNLASGAVEDDRVVMGGECKFKKVKTGRDNDPKDRVFMLKFSGNPKPLMFWMQDPDSSKDEESVKKTNVLLDNPNANVGASQPAALGSLGNASNFLSLLGRPQIPSTAAAPASGPSSSASGNAAATPFGNLDLSSLLSTVAAAPRPPATRPPAPRVPATPNLQDVFAGEDIVRTGILNDPAVQADLVRHLPAEQQQSENLESTVRSAQFQQSLGSLSSALRNPDNLQSVLSNFGLNPADGHEQLLRGDGVGAFLSALQASANQNNSSGDATNTDSAADEKEDEKKMEE